MGLFGFGKKDIFECTCGCGCRESFEKYGYIIKGKKEYEYRRYGKIWKGDYTICIDCNEGKHTKSTEAPNESKLYNVTTPNRTLGYKYEQLQGLLKGISDEEFLILLKLGFMRKGLSISKIRRKIISSNDIVLTLTGKNMDSANNEKSSYVAYVDRSPNEYDTIWIDQFLRKANESESYFGHCNQILIMNINENLIKYELPKKSTGQVRDRVELFLGKNFFKYFFKDSLENNTVLEKLFPHENVLWDRKSQNEQSNYCEQINVDYIQYNRLWKYPLYHQCRLIFALSGVENKSKQQESRTNEQNSFVNEDEFDWKRFYGILDIPENSTVSEIKVAYRENMKFYHPDKFETRSPEDKEKAMKKAKHLTEGWNLLKDSEKI